MLQSPEIKEKELLFPQVNNDLYEEEGEKWWSNDSALFMMYALNAARVPYYQRIINEHFQTPLTSLNALEIGSGGGILCEQIAKMGCKTYGIDPSPQSVNTAQQHAKGLGLNIHYQTGKGEELPFQSGTFDIVLCCDVIEHVENPPQVIREASRVLKKNGLFLHETINRTWLSKLIYIKLFQEWKKYAWLPEDFHLYERFIKPRELENMMKQAGLRNIDFAGIEPIDKDPPRILKALKQRAKGEIDFGELAKRFKMKEGKYLSSSYMGYAIKL